MLSQKIAQLVKTIYTTPESGASFSSAKKIQKQLKKKFNTFATIRNIQHWLDKNLTYSLHHASRHSFKRNPTLITYIDEQWQIDLLFVPDLKTKYVGALICIDVASRFVWAEAIKNKTGKEVTNAMQKILDRATPRKPAKIQGDMGTEFYNRNFKKLLKDSEIELFSSHSDHKASIAERVIRTFKEKLYRILEENHKLTPNWEELVQPIVNSYNDPHHNSIKMAPSEVTKKNINQVLENLYGQYWTKDQNQKNTKFSVGDRIRISSARHPFKKGYKGKWKEEIFIVDSIKYTLPNNVYILKEWDGTLLQGIFYPFELTKVHSSGDSEFRIEKVLAERTKNKKKELKVRWMGWPSKYDSWLPAAAVKDL